MDPPEHDMRMIGLLKAVTLAWFTNTVLFTLIINHTRYDVLHTKVKCLSSVGPACLVPLALNKHYSAGHGPNNVFFNVFYLGLVGEQLG